MVSLKNEYGILAVKTQSVDQVKLGFCTLETCYSSDDKFKIRKIEAKQGTSVMEDNFWDKKQLCEMNDKEWEALCDGCGACCLIQLEDEETEERIFTKVACKLLDIGACRCKSYENRHDIVPTCSKVSLELLKTADWLPPTCAYRLLYEGKPLHWWHPLISKEPESVHQSGVSVRGWARSEEDIGDEIDEKYYAPNLFAKFSK